MDDVKRLTITVEEAAKLLGVGRRTMYAACERGEVPTIRVGRRILIPKHGLERMLADAVEGVQR